MFAKLKQVARYELSLTFEQRAQPNVRGFMLSYRFLMVFVSQLCMTVTLNHFGAAAQVDLLIPHVISCLCLALGGMPSPAQQGTRASALASTCGRVKLNKPELYELSIT